jgi:hypothetical protein
MLVVLHNIRPQFRYAWLTAVGVVFLVWISIIFWWSQLPLSVTLPPWQPADLFSTPSVFAADNFSWPYALSLVTLALAILLTASAREGFPDYYGWAVSLILCGLGLLAVTANNPLTLVLVWAALDLAEVITMLRSLKERGPSERTVIGFSVRAVGIVLVLLAQVVGSTAGKPADFTSMSPEAGLLLLAAAGLRLGVLPVHLPYISESSLRRGLGTMLRLVSAAASLVLLAHIPLKSLASPLTPVLLLLSGIAALFGGWMWLRAPDELTGRPFWIIGLASLAMASACMAIRPGQPPGAWLLFWLAARYSWHRPNKYGLTEFCWWAPGRYPPCHFP